MRYYFSTRIDGPFETAIERARQALKQEGFGIISEIDMQKALKEKIQVDFRPYVILGACNPGLAHEALKLEDKVGTMLPCNVIVQDAGDGIEIAAIDPVASMRSIENPALLEKASLVGEKLQSAILLLAGKSESDAENESHVAEVERRASASRAELDAIHPAGTDPLHDGP